MGAILPQILIILAVGAIIYLVIKKFSYLASVDTENMREEKQAELKVKILEDRLKRNFVIFGQRLGAILNPLGQKLHKKITAAGQSVTRLNTRLKTQRQEVIKRHPERAKLLLQDILNDAEKFLRAEQYAEAEKMLIEALTLNPRDKDVYYRLGSLYLAQKNYPHALATFKHILGLELKGLEILEQQAGPDSPEVTEKRQKLASLYHEIAEVNFQQDIPEQARDSLRHALEYDARNPKYLDFFCELCIILKDKDEASDCLKKLRQINPENGKIEKFNQEIANL